MVFSQCRDCGTLFATSGVVERTVIGACVGERGGRVAMVGGLGYTISHIVGMRCVGLMVSCCTLMG